GGEALVALRVAAQDVRHRTGDEEILLLEAELAARERFVLGIEHLRDALGERLLLDGSAVVAVVEDLEVELLRGARSPEPQRVHRARGEAGHGVVVGGADDLLSVDPAMAKPSTLTKLFHATADLNRHALLGPR